MIGISSAFQAIEIALAVPALVVMPDAGPDQLDVRDVADDRVAEGDVLLEDVELLGGQLAGLAQEMVGNADLADVVEKTGELNGAPQVGIETKLAGEEDGIAGHVLRVALGVSVLGVDRDDQPLQDVEAARRDLLLLGAHRRDADGVATAGLAPRRPPPPRLTGAR